MSKIVIPVEVIDQFEDLNWLWGKKTRDIPIMAAWRLEFRRNYERLAFFCLITAIFCVWAASLPRSIHWLMQLNVDFNVANMIVVSLRARMLSRQLERRAAEQLLRDLNGIGG